MTDAEKRIESLHARMEKRRRARERQRMAALGAASGGLALCFFLLATGGRAARPVGETSPYSGAAMLFADAGGYVLLAVAAFMAGVVIAVVCLRRNRRGGEDPRGDGEG